MAIYIRKPDGTYMKLPFDFSDIQNNPNKVLVSDGSNITYVDPALSYEEYTGSVTIGTSETTIFDRTFSKQGTVMAYIDLSNLSTSYTYTFKLYINGILFDSITVDSTYLSARRILPAFPIKIAPNYSYKITGQASSGSYTVNYRVVFIYG